MTKKPRQRQPFIRRGAETDDLWLEDLRGAVWNSLRDTKLTWAQIAGGKLHPNTVAKFAYGETKRPMFRTIFRIMEALGMRMRRD